MAWAENDFHLVLDWLTPGTATEYVGWCQLVSHKQEALCMASRCAHEIDAEGPALLDEADQPDLDLLFRQLVMVCRGDLITGQLFLAVKGPEHAQIAMGLSAVDEIATSADAVASEARTAFGEDFFGQFPRRMEPWAAWGRNGNAS